MISNPAASIRPGNGVAVANTCRSVEPGSPALPFAGRFQEARIAGDTIIVDILLVGSAVDPGIATGAEKADRALLDESHLDLLPFQPWLAEPRAEHVRRNAAVLLADFHIQLLALAMDDTGIGQRPVAKNQQQQDQRQAHG